MPSRHLDLLDKLFGFQKGTKSLHYPLGDPTLSSRNLKSPWYSVCSETVCASSIRLLVLFHGHGGVCTTSRCIIPTPSNQTKLLQSMEFISIWIFLTKAAHYHHHSTEGGKLALPSSTSPTDASSIFRPRLIVHRRRPQRSIVYAQETKRLGILDEVMNL